MLEATATFIVVKVPVGASFQPISVAKSNLIAFAAKPFLVTFNGAGMDFTATSFQPAVAIGGGGNIAAADFNGDGKIDIARAGYTNSFVNVYKNSSVGGVFHSAYDWQAAVTNPMDVKLGDMNGDGLIDIAVSTAFNNTVSIHKNISTLSFVRFQNTTTVCTITGTGVGEMSIADLDNDGKLDIAVSVEGGNKISIF